MRGVSTHFAPEGALGSLIGQFVRSSSCIENASHCPSGDHSRPEAPESRRVICDVAPSASIQRTQIWLPRGSPSAVYAMRSPVGDHVALEPLTRKRFFDPSAFMIQTDDSRRSLILSIQPRV